MGRYRLDRGHQWRLPHGRLPLPLLPSAILLPVIVGAPLLLLSKRVGQLLDSIPTTWLVALQLYRVFGSQWLAYWLRGLLPGLATLSFGGPYPSGQGPEARRGRRKERGDRFRVGALKPGGS